MNERHQRNYETRMRGKYGEIPTPLTPEQFEVGYSRIEDTMTSALAEQTQPDVLAVILFGSWTHGNPHIQSDVDFNLILSDEGFLRKYTVGYSFINDLQSRGLQNLDPWLFLSKDEFVREHKRTFYRDFKVFSTNPRIHGLAENSRSKHQSRGISQFIPGISLF